MQRVHINHFSLVDHNKFFVVILTLWFFSFLVIILPFVVSSPFVYFYYNLYHLYDFCLFISQ